MKPLLPLLGFILLVITSCKSRQTEVNLLEESSEGAWTANFSTLEGRIEVAQSAVQTHPQMVLGNLRFNRSLLDAIQYVPELLTILGDDAASMVVGDALMLTYNFESEDLKTDLKALAEIKSRISNDIRAVSIALGGFSDIREDAARLETTDAKLLAKFLVASAIVYDPNSGKALSNFEARLEDLERAELSSMYFDNFKEHIRPSLSSILPTHPNWTAAINQTESQFIRKTSLELQP